jgi:hypothetical protein
VSTNVFDIPPVAVRFPEDHPIEALRGWRVPNRERALQSLAQRIAWLESRIETRGCLGKPNQAETNELAALLVLASEAGFPLEDLVDECDAVLERNGAKYRAVVARSVSVSDARERLAGHAAAAPCPRCAAGEHAPGPAAALASAPVPLLYPCGHVVIEGQ